MDKVKREQVVVGLLVAILIVSVWGIMPASRYSYSDLGFPAPEKDECSSLKDSANSPVTLSFDTPDVGTVRENIKDLVAKHKGNVENDSLSSYADPSYPGGADESADLTITFGEMPDSFLEELAVLVKDAGGRSTNYSDGSYDMGYTPYSSCVSMMNSVAAAKLELEILTRALKRERDTRNVGMLGQSVADARINLENELNSLSSSFASYEKPTVNISLYTLREDKEDVYMNLRPEPYNW